MLNSVSIFEASIAEARNLNALYNHLQTLGIPFPAEDLLRAQIAYSVGAFDKLMHDLIRIGMTEIFVGTRPATPKYQAETFDMQTHDQIKSATVPPPVFVFGQAVAKKHSRLSFQDPEKVSEGLSLIWDEKHKWDKIGTALGKSGKDTQTELRLIVQRRNSIVHESDMHPLTNAKSPIAPNEASNVCGFLENCGRAITNLVK